MSSLYLLQYTCLLVFAMQVLLLVVSRFQMSVVNRQYEKSRWSLVAADVLLVTHYALQMACGFRAHSDNAGLIVNILFYTPSASWWPIPYSIWSAKSVVAVATTCCLP